MEYLNIEQGRAASGLRLVLTKGMPGPWAEAAKAIFNVKDIDFSPIEQIAAQPNDELQKWTGQTTAPVAVYNDEPVRYSWLDILMLAERLAPLPALLPSQMESRALVIGLCREIAGEDGLGWNRRLLMLAPAMAMEEPPQEMQRMADKYGWSDAAGKAAANKLKDILDGFTLRLRQAKSPYVVGDELTAADIFLANFMGMFKPLSPELNPMPEFLRKLYSATIPEIESHLSPELFAHRDQMYAEHLPTPLQF